MSLVYALRTAFIASVLLILLPGLSWAQTRFLLSGVVMTAAFLLVLGLPEQVLRDKIEKG